jgi:hypothetical protein
MVRLRAPRLRRDGQDGPRHRAAVSFPSRRKFAPRRRPDAAARLKNGTCETMSLPDYDSRCRAESERGGHGRLDRELRWRGNLKDGQRRCCEPEGF